METSIPEYPKIQSIFLRDPATRHKNFLLGQYSRPEFEYLANSLWVATEKIDGTNIRIHWDGRVVRFLGRTKDSQIPAPLVARLQDLFPPQRFVDFAPITLFGEGYGRKIQSVGDRYSPAGVDFILFDVASEHGHWLDREQVEHVGHLLEIKPVPIIATVSLNVAPDLVAEGFLSRVSHDSTLSAEGLVLRPLVELQDRRGERIITKIKYRDFH